MLWLKAFYNEEYKVLYTIQAFGVTFKKVSEDIRVSFARKCIKSIKA